MAQRWQYFVTWTARRMGERDHRITAPKTYVHPLAQQLGVAYLPARPKVRRALRYVFPALRQAEWRLPWWVGSERRLKEACGVLKINDLRAWIVRWVLENHPEVPILHIVRHPGGQLNSGLSRFFDHLSPEELTSERWLYQDILKTAIVVDPHWRSVLGSDVAISQFSLMEAVAWFWRYNNEEIYTLGQNYPQYRLVVYEQLAQNPLDYAQQVYSQCRLPFTPEIQGHIQQGTETSVWGKLNKPPAAVAEVWKKKLSPEHQALAQRVLEGSPMAAWWP